MQINLNMRTNAHMGPELNPASGRDFDLAMSA
jgi:hypothetical protein